MWTYLDRVREKEKGELQRSNDLHKTRIFSQTEFLIQNLNSLQSKIIVDTVN